MGDSATGDMASHGPEMSRIQHMTVRARSRAIIVSKTSEKSYKLLKNIGNLLPFERHS
jgi:hypothetical protein